MTREQEFAFRERLNDLKGEYAERMGWDGDDWYYDDDKLYAAECYAYDTLASESGES